MEVKVDKSGPCNARITIRVPPEEFEAEVGRALVRVGRHVSLKGFRPGKAPAALIERTHGPAVRRETVQELLGRALKQAVEEHELKPAAHPRVKPEELVPEPGQALETAFDVALRPEIELGEYKGLEVEARSVAVVEEEIDAALADLRRQFSRPEPVDESGLAEDGFVLAKVELLHEGAVVLSRDGLRLGVSTPLPGSDPEAFRSALTGAKDGDVREVPVTFPADFEHEPARGRAGVGRVRVDKAFKIVPPEEADLFQVLSVDDATAMRAAVGQRIEEAKSRQETTRIEALLLERVLDTHPLELPESVVADQIRDRTAELRRQLEGSGVTGTELDSQVAREEGEIRTASERSLRALFLVEAIAQKEGLGVTEEDLMTELRSIAKRNQATVEQVREYYAERRLFEQLGLELLERKVRAFLREHAVTSGAV